MTRVSDEDKDKLRSLGQLVPDWLLDFRSEDPFPFAEFRRSRIVIYPGSGTDGGPVELFGSTHSAHCFVYADYSLNRADIECALDHAAHGFKGYRSVCRLTLDEADLTPHGWSPHADPKEVKDTFRDAHVHPFGFLEVLERDETLSDEHGAKRLAIVFLGADGIATYDALFCQDNGPKPFALVIVDHGFGLGYARFDEGGLLHTLARRCSVFPEYIWIPHTNSSPWNEYDAVQPSDGIPPRLYKRRQAT